MEDIGIFLHKQDGEAIEADPEKKQKYLSDIKLFDYSIIPTQWWKNVKNKTVKTLQDNMGESN